MASQYHVSGGDSVWSVWLWKVSTAEISGYIPKAVHGLRLIDSNDKSVNLNYAALIVVASNFMSNEAIVCVWSQWMSLEFLISDRIHEMCFSFIYRSVVGRALANEVSRLIIKHVVK